ncbi:MULTISPECIES: SRPBCC family protein [Flavobacterium]|uniref:SRPBCC family protein n=1 Tax=Flavobacterium jumunjinense TaxID=998845 RepID=A0ABV5GLK2_9FLAO|nr:MULTISPECIES: SRPBCC family protein [Flavobacterium]
MKTNSQKIEQVKVIMIVNSSVKEAFNAAIQSDLSNIFKKYKSLPSIIGTDLTESWIKEGLVRTIFFEDDTQVTETLLKVIPHEFFSYKVENFTSTLRYLTTKIEGDWIFTKKNTNQTQIEWNYNIYPKNVFAKFLIKLTLKKDLHGYLTNALKIVKQNSETKKMNPNQFI